MIFQDPMTALTPVYDRLADSASSFRPTIASSHAARPRAIELSEAAGIANPATAVDRYPHQLSGGMRQRAFIAMASVPQSVALLIADEPTTALDVTVQAQILELLQRLRRDFGSSIILITHDMGVVAEIADRVMVMYAGRIVERGTTRELFTQPWHPYTWGLHDLIPYGRRQAATVVVDPRQPAVIAQPAAGLRLRASLPLSFHGLRRAAGFGRRQRPEAACFIPPESRAELHATGGITRRAPRDRGGFRKWPQPARPCCGRSMSRSSSWWAAARSRAIARSSAGGRRVPEVYPGETFRTGWRVRLREVDAGRCLMRLYEITSGDIR